MFAPLRPLALAALIASATSALAPAQEPGPRSTARAGRAEAAKSDVMDDGGMFSPEAVRKAKEALGRVDRAYKVAVTIETVESLRGQEIDEFATRRAEQLDHKGIFILIARQDRKAEALASPRELLNELGRPRLHAIRDAFTAEFRKGDTDAGLLKGVAAAERALAEARPEAAKAAALVEGGTSVGGSALVARGQVRLTVLGARKAIQGAEAKAVELKLQSNIAVVDDAGLLLAFERMDGARPASIATSQTKAVSAATFRSATGPVTSGGKPDDALFNLSLQAAAASSGGKITALQGGIPIVVDGQVVGAIGVAGGSGEQDLEVARAGVAAFVTALGEPEKDKEKAHEETKPKDAAAEPTPR